MYPDVMVLSSCWFCRSEALYPALPSFCPSCIAITADASALPRCQGEFGGSNELYRSCAIGTAGEVADSLTFLAPRDCFRIAGFTSRRIGFVNTGRLLKTYPTSVSALAIKRQIDFPDGREFRPTGPHVRNPGACGSRRTADVTHSRCVGHELSFHPWMSARRIGGGCLLTSPSWTSEAYGLYQVQQHRHTCSRRSFAAAVVRESPDRKYRRRNTGRFRRAPQPGSILVTKGPIGCGRSRSNLDI
jgi:hypothetical protein